MYAWPRPGIFYAKFGGQKRFVQSRKWAITNETVHQEVVKYKAISHTEAERICGNKCLLKNIVAALTSLSVSQMNQIQ